MSSSSPERSASDGAPTIDGSRTSLGELARLFLRLGLTSFGGPVAHVAMMEDEVVRRRRWMSRADFLDLVGATNLIPGPNSTELAIHIGRVRAGWPGLLVAGAAFILPAAVIVGAIAWGYVRAGGLPQVVALLAAVKPVVIAVVLQAIVSLARGAIRSTWLALVALASLIAAVVGVHELAILGAAAAVGAIRAAYVTGHSAGARQSTIVVPPAATPWLALASASSSSVTVGLIASAGATTTALFAVFLRIGAVLFGSGYVLLAFLRSELVERLQWLTERQILDAVAVGQVTPGPVFTTATFIGWLLGGAAGAAAATLGIFLPAFVFVAASAPLLPRLRRSPVAAAVLDAVNVASLALMTNAAWLLGRAALVDGFSVTIAIASAVALLAWRVNSAWLVLGAGAIALARWAL